MARLGAMILTGGASSRMGEDKGALDWGGVRAVDRVARLARALGSAPVITVGPQDYGFPCVADDSLHGGPVGGVLAGAPELSERGCARALVLAVDSPTIRPEELAALVSQPAPGAAFDGFPLPLTLELGAIPADAQAGWPLMRLIERAGLTLLSPPPGAAARLRGANTRAERDLLLAELRAVEGRVE